MSDESGVEPRSAEGGAGSTMYRPSARGGLEPAPQEQADYRDRLRSRRWDAAPLANPEVEKTDPRLAVLLILVLAAVTLLVIVLGYGVGLWSLPA
jgi:hypothetical protein